MEDALVLFGHTTKITQIQNVLILVLMEDALVLEIKAHYCDAASVLILVVMEDALVHALTRKLARLYPSLNPCCNGRCTRTGYTLKVLHDPRES